VRRRAPSRFLLEIDVGERLPVGVADDEAGVRSSTDQGGGKRHKFGARQWDRDDGHKLFQTKLSKMQLTLKIVSAKAALVLALHRAS